MKGLEICRRTLTSSTGLISGRFKEDVKRSCQNAGAEFIVVAREISKCVTSSLLSPSLLSELPIYCKNYVIAGIMTQAPIWLVFTVAGKSPLSTH